MDDEEDDPFPSSSSRSPLLLLSLLYNDVFVGGTGSGGGGGGVMPSCVSNVSTLCCKYWHSEVSCTIDDSSCRKKGELAPLPSEILSLSGTKWGICLVSGDVRRLRLGRWRGLEGREVLLLLLRWDDMMVQGKGMDNIGVGSLLETVRYIYICVSVFCLIDDIANERNLKKEKKTNKAEG